jgi:hypothetical protein
LYYGLVLALVEKWVASHAVMMLLHSMIMGMFVTASV